MACSKIIVNSLCSSMILEIQERSSKFLMNQTLYFVFLEHNTLLSAVKITALYT